MNLRESLRNEHSRSNTLRIVKYIGADKQRFSELLDIFSEGDYRLTQRAAWPLAYIAEEQPQLVKPQLRQLVKLLDLPLHDAVRRNVIRLLQDMKIPSSLAGKITDRCFGYLRSAEAPVALKAFSMSALANICKSYPELIPELRSAIEELLLFKDSAAIRSRGRKVLKQLDKISGTV
jgi:hypothetical protein